MESLKHSLMTAVALHEPLALNGLVDHLLEIGDPHGEALHRAWLQGSVRLGGQLPEALRHERGPSDQTGAGSFAHPTEPIHIQYGHLMFHPASPESFVDHRRAAQAIPFFFGHMRKHDSGEIRAAFQRYLDHTKHPAADKFRAASLIHNQTQFFPKSIGASGNSFADHHDDRGGYWNHGGSQLAYLNPPPVFPDKRPEEPFQLSARVYSSGWIAPDGTFHENDSYMGHIQTAEKHFGKAEPRGTGFVGSAQKAHEAGWAHLGFIPSLGGVEYATYRNNGEHTEAQIQTAKRVAKGAKVSKLHIEHLGKSREIPVKLLRYPNVQSLQAAMAAVKSRNQQEKLKALKQLLIHAEEPGRVLSAMSHSPETGFLPSAVVSLATDHPVLSKYLGSWFGLMNQHERIVAFHVRPEGEDSLHTVTGNPKELSEKLLAAGIPKFTISGNKALIFDQGSRFNIPGSQVTRGSGQVLGSRREPGAAAGRDAHRTTIRAIERASGAGESPQKLAVSIEPQTPGHASVLVKVPVPQPVGQAPAAAPTAPQLPKAPQRVILLPQ